MKLMVRLQDMIDIVNGKIWSYTTFYLAGWFCLHIS